MKQEPAKINLNQALVLERLFIGFLEEMTGVATIDSYRAKSASARSVLAELYQVLTDWKDKKIKSPDTVLVIRDEAFSLLEEDEYLKYGKISKAFFLESLKELKAEGKFIPLETILKVEYNLYYAIVLNAGYNRALLSGIEAILLKEYDDESAFVLAQKSLNKLCSVLVAELLNSGYSKVFIRLFMRYEFSKTDSNNFVERWNKFKNTFSNEVEKSYIIIFKVFVTVKGVLDADFGQIKTGIEEMKADFGLSGEEFSEFFEKSSLSNFVCLETKSLDRFQAVVEARKQLSTILDIVHLLHPSSTQSIYSQAIAIERGDTSTAHVVRYAGQNDGPKPNPKTYSKLISKLSQIRKNPAVAEDVSDKLYACIKHLRLSTESDDLEQNFLNCWIGLENIFANYFTETSTFSRIKENLVNAHLVTYVKRNVHNFDSMISGSSIKKQISSYNKHSIDYLTDINSYDEIIALEDYYPIIAYRARYLKSVLFNGKRRIEYVTKHKKNLERHLVRMYRIRNEIVHDAKSSYKLDNLYNNLVYYLTFILSKCIEYFYDCKQKPILLHKIGLDDFFHYQQAIVGSMKKNEYSLTECMAAPHSVELFI